MKRLSESHAVGSAHAPADFDFVSRDVGETQSWLVGRLRRDLVLEPLGRPGFEARLTAHGFASAQLVHAAYPLGMRLGRGLPHDNLTLRLVSAGGTLYSVGRETLAAVPGQCLILNTALADRGEYAEGSVHETVTLHAGEVARTLQDAFERPVTERLDIAMSFDAGSATGAAVAGIVAAIAGGFRGEAALAEAPYAARMLRNALIMLILESVPHRYSSWFERRAVAPAPWQIRRAIDFIDGHMAGPLTVQDVAGAIGIGLRSLQEGFRRHKQISPHDYIKRARLNGVREELLNPLSSRSIEAIARHWGFVNRGHFALDYRQAFGEQPSQTRKRR
ncbi:MAG TPA: AraC family transcriptional regulator [Bosea sp. (in: a-proteobacteria)]|jgi:AraC-like DNA-binding protein|uniref:helix-turn-helix transcriptional regulator n=1 Tax=Bosea sp. (in: a-proteobacteria) TaxID=1871050 RepID=UPI002E164D0D|nr:AraC family transcriptional regulator [Bosea sp. (in: a-proteobacteria)]